MSGEPAKEAQWRDEFHRIVENSYRSRPLPIGPYMRWPLGAALVLMAAQVAVSSLVALGAASLLTAGHTAEVTTASLLWTLAVTTFVAISLGLAAYNVRSRSLLAINIALAIEVGQVAIRSVSIAQPAHQQFADYFGLAWAAAALAVLAMPSSRAYCTRRRTHSRG